MMICGTSGISLEKKYVYAFVSLILIHICACIGCFLLCLCPILLFLANGSCWFGGLGLRYAWQHNIPVVLIVDAGLGNRLYRNMAQETGGTGRSVECGQLLQA